MSGKIPTPLVICMIICIGLVLYPLAIASTVLGALRPGQCDNIDIMGLDVGRYLLGSGISGLIVTTIFLILYVVMLRGGENSIIFSQLGVIVVTLVSALFGLAWFIVGAIVLFRSNIECIHLGSSHVIYALVMWCISAFNLFSTCCLRKSSSSDA